MDTTRRIGKRCKRETKRIQTNRRKMEGGKLSTGLGFNILNGLTFFCVVGDFSSK